MLRTDALRNVQRANRALAWLWRHRLLPPPSIDAAALEEAALRGSPASSFGADQWWREPFERVVSALRDEAELSPLGMAMAWGQIVMALRGRLRAASLWQAHPHILDRPVNAPIIILGQMRSGTTRLQRLLACDSRLAHTRLFESLIPVPQRGRRLKARAGLRILRALNPQLALIHPTGADVPEEEFGLFSFSFGAAQFEAQWRVPSFARWWEGADTRPLYREFKALVQTNAWARGDPPDKPAILKAPQFLQDLPVLVETFPDARFVLMERDPAQVIPSSASLVWNQMRIHSDAVDKLWIGREWLRKTRLRQERARSALPSACFPISYEAMNRGWRKEMTRLYDHLDLALPAELQAQMAAYLSSATTHLGHRYALEDFGLSAADMIREFSPL